MELKYFWKFDQQKGNKLFDDPLECKQDCINTLQDLTNKGGYPRNFIYSVRGDIQKSDHIVFDPLTDSQDYFRVESWSLFLEPKEHIPPKFRYINYNNEWKVYGNYDESEIIDVYSHFYLPTKIQKNKKPRTRIRDGGEFDKYIYDIIPSPNLIYNDERKQQYIQVNDFKVYQPGEKIKVLDNGKHKTYIVKEPQFTRYLSLDRKHITPLRNDIIISLWYSKDDQYLVDKLTPHIYRDDIKIKDKFNINEYTSSLTFDPFINDCNVILYTKNSVNDPELNLKIGKILTMDLTLYVIFVEVPRITRLLNPDITTSHVLYPEEIFEIINGIKERTYSSRYTEQVAHLTQYEVNDAEKLFTNTFWKWSPPSLILLIYNRYNNTFLQKPNILKVIDKIINNNKHVLPKSLFNQVVKHAKLKTVKEIDHKNTNTCNRLKVESGISNNSFFFGTFNYQTNELTSHVYRNE